MTLEDLLESLNREIHACTKCPLSRTRLNAVPGEGPVNARVVLVGEAPGAKEDETGRPFVGKSGELLASLLKDVGLDRDEVFITSILKSRPPRNRAPRASEINACLPYLYRQLNLIDPTMIVLLGGVAIKSLAGNMKLSECHGELHETNNHTFFMTYHPAAAMRFPRILDVMKSDFELLRRELEMRGG
ncbi:MAG: uracil-DNA glycosylase [Candidatus Thorarchaeota archaeon]|nr:MAG: uracil-DNA glycosylase [Candidatus Thorarchaeota archaeon]